MNVKFIIELLVPIIAVIVAAYLLPGVTVNTFFHAALVALVLSFLNVFVKPVLQILTIPITLVTLGLFLIVLDALIILMADGLIGGFSVRNFWWAVLFSFIVSIVSSVMSNIFNTKS